MDQSDTKTQKSGQTQAAPAQPATPPAIDIAQLADRVYQLMREDLRLEQARGQRAAQRKAR